MSVVTEPPVESSRTGVSWFVISGLLVVALIAAWQLSPLSGSAPSASQPGSLPGSASLQDQVNCSAPHEWRETYLSTSTPAPDLSLMGSVPQGFKPVYAVDCGPGIDPSQAPKYLQGNFDALLAQLAIPSDTEKHSICTAMFVSVVDLWLVNDQGKAIHVKEPLDGCNNPKSDVHRELEKLKSSSLPPNGYTAAV